MASDVLRMDWSRLLETSRYCRNDGNTGIRSPFQKDIDRIIFSDHFRRLARKTQVHPLNENDHIHSRLTHSLEVASVGKSLGELIGVSLEEKGELPEALKATDVGEAVQAACLAHDIGNPPFGHSGEEAIKDWFKSKHELFRHIGPEYEADFTRLDGNAMAVRILLSTGFQQIGMSPTYAVIGALLKYPWPSYKAAKDKFSYFQTEAEAMEGVADTLGLIRFEDRYSRPPLAYLTEAADDICYRIIDIEDGTEMGILDEQFMYDRFAGALGLDSSDRYAWLPDAHFRQRNSVLRAKLISEATQEAAALFEVYYDEIMTGNFDVTSSLMEKSVTGICRTIYDVYEQTKGTLFLSRRKATLELGAQNALGRLLDQTMADVDTFCHARQSGLNDKIKALIGPEVMEAISKDEPHCQYKVMMTIVDYIAGMTDHYATNLCRKLLGLGY